jgi:Trypsin
VFTPVRFTLAVVAVVLATATCAAAVTGSRPDGDDHPYVGALVVDGSVACSGVLVDDDVFVTAGHCTEGFPAAAEVAVSFDTSLDPDAWTLHPGTPSTHPRYRGKGQNPRDLAVVVLDDPAGIEPAALPAAGSAESLPRRTLLTSVGYGYSGRAADGSWIYDGLRRAAESPLKDVERSLVRLSTREAGPCLGDSGGPQLSGDTVVSITIGGSKDCSGKAEGYRLDTNSARNFLGRFVDLP